MKLVELDTEIETPKNTRYLVRRRLLVPVRDVRGKTRWYRGGLRFALPRRLNWLWRWLAR
jgi:hypothetical protein